MVFCKVTHTLHVCLSFVNACYERYNGIVTISWDISLALQSKRICPPSLFIHFAFLLNPSHLLCFGQMALTEKSFHPIFFIPPVFQRRAGAFSSQAKTVSFSDHLQNIAVVAGAVFQTHQPRLHLIIYSTLVELINVVNPLNI